MTMPIRSSESLLTEVAASAPIPIPSTMTDGHGPPPNLQYVFTDGACPKNGQGARAAGYAAKVFVGTAGEAAATYAEGTIVTDAEGPPTNNRAELTAILEGLRLADKSLATVVYTDSRYAINCLKPDGWAKRWATVGWKTVAGTPVKNMRLIQDILARAREFGRGGVQYRHVAAHTGDTESFEGRNNDDVDKRAVAATTSASTSAAAAPAAQAGAPAAAKLVRIGRRLERDGMHTLTDEERKFLRSIADGHGHGHGQS